MSKLLVAIRRVVRIMELNAGNHFTPDQGISRDTPIYDQLEREWVARHGQSVMS